MRTRSERLPAGACECNLLDGRGEVFPARYAVRPGHGDALEAALTVDRAEVVFVERRRGALGFPWSGHASRE